MSFLHATLAPSEAVAGNRAAHPGRSGLRSALRTVVATVRAWRRRARQRKELRMLTDYELRDFLFSRSDAAAEASKPFWVP